MVQLPLTCQEIKENLSSQFMTTLMNQKSTYVCLKRDYNSVAGVRFLNDF